MARSGLIYLKRDSLEFHDGETVKVLPFTSEAVKNLELKSQELLAKEITKFLVAEELKPRNVEMFLSKDVFFAKTSTAKDAKNKERAIQAFLDEIPIDNTKTSHKVFPTNKGFTIVVANEELFVAIKNAFEANKWKVRRIVPEISKMQTLIEDKAAKKMLDLTPKGERDKKKVYLYLAGVVSLVLVAGSIGFFVLSRTNTNDVTPQEKTTNAESEAEKVIEPETITPVLVNKEDYSILILNGSGIAGQAGTTKETLETAEFQNIEVGNADTQNFEETVLSYKETVPEEMIEEASNLLQELYESVGEEAIGDETLPDIVITTGVLLTTLEE